MSGSPRSGASTPLSVGMREGAAVEDSPAVSVTGVPRVSVELNELNDERRGRSGRRRRRG